METLDARNVRCFAAASLTRLDAELRRAELEKATMTEIEKLMRLRSKLIARRRMLVAVLVNAEVEQLSGEAISRIQNAIEAVNSAITQEKQSSPTVEPARSGAPEYG
jgi:hypothetical protein